ncbi:MAG: hypothetical protein US76_01185 [Parcubacteria group bacterium GW2011_GWA2_38_13b]|nr:MAG: hypothetical protein US76_01185 [Parcubacteria group bacterium GW2011_GWA2_38_13b]
MEKETIRQIQRKIVQLLHKNNNKPLYVTSVDNCSEVARLAGCWIFEKLPLAKIYILKGKNILKTKRCHDILAVDYSENITLIDPTVWQFFKNKKSIFIKTTNSLANSLFEANKLYGGKWEISEILSKDDCKKSEFKRIIALNIKELK